MSEQGMLRDKNDIKLLILYILRSLDRMISSDDLGEVVLQSGSANYFECTDAVDQLLASGHIEKLPGEEGELLRLTVVGKESIRQLEKRLPYTIREAAQQASLRLLARIKEDSEILCEIREAENGAFVDCGILDMGEPILSLSVFTANRIQAQAVCKRFRENPGEVYRQIIASLTDTSHCQDK